MVCFRACRISTQPKSTQNRAGGLPSFRGRGCPGGTFRFLGCLIERKVRLLYGMEFFHVVVKKSLGRVKGLGLW